MGNLRSMAIRAAANQHEMVQRLGRIQSIEIDKDQKCISASLLLKGELEPIEAKATYELADTPEGQVFRLLHIEVSREWLQQLATLVLEQKGSFTIPMTGTKGAVLSMIL